MRIYLMTAAILAGAYTCVAFAGSLTQDQQRLAQVPGEAAPNGAPLISSTAPVPVAFPLFLDRKNEIGEAELESLLRQVLSQKGEAEREHQEAAYVLARTLQHSAEQELQDTSQAASKSASGGNAPAPALGHMAEAIALFNQSARLDLLRERSRWHAVESATKLNDENSLRLALTDLLDYYAGQAAGKSHHRAADSGTAVGALYALAQSYIRTSENDRAEELLIEIRKQYPTSDYAKGAAYYLGVIKSNDTADATAPSEAFQLFRQYLHGNSNGRFAPEVVARMLALAKDHPDLTLTAADHEQFGDVYFSARRWKEALAEWPDVNQPHKLLRKAVCYFHTKPKKEAIQALIAAIKADPHCRYINTATLIGDPLTRQETKVLWQQILAAHPAKEDAPLWNIAKRSEAKEAVPLYQQLIARYPTSEFAPESLWWLFWNKVKESERDPSQISQALELAHHGITRYPTTRAAARLGFWAGKLYERIKRPGDARQAYLITAARFGNDYYAMRARARLRALLAPEPDRSFATSPERGEHATAWSWPSPQALASHERLAQHSQELAELFRLRQYDECLSLLPKSTDPVFKAAVYAADGEPMHAIGAVTRHISGSPQTTELWKLAYPLEYGQAVISGAKSYGLDPLLVHALIREESRYNPDALSRSKAIGLMQLMPGTAYGVAKRIGVPLANQAEIFKPEINIKLGIDYLAYTIRRFQGNAMMAVASYNGGPNAVKAWFTQFQRDGLSDLDSFVEEIKFRETRDYVRKVFGAYWNYEHIYGLSDRDRRLEHEISTLAQAANTGAHAAPGQAQPAGTAAPRAAVHAAARHANTTPRSAAPAKQAAHSPSPAASHAATKLHRAPAKHGTAPAPNLYGHHILPGHTAP